MQNYRQTIMRKSTGSKPETLEEFWKVMNKHRGRKKSNQPAVSLDEKLKRHRKKFK